MGRCGCDSWNARDEQDFDVIRLGAYRDGNAMGKDLDTWLASGGELQAAFEKVVNCRRSGTYVCRLDRSERLVQARRIDEKSRRGTGP